MARRLSRSRLAVPVFARRSLIPTLGFILLLASPSRALPDSPRLGDSPMPDPPALALLVDYYEAFLRNQDIQAFRLSVAARYTEGTLGRLAHMGEPQARRAAVLALGLTGSIAANDAVGRALVDPDPVVRNLAHNALWAIWFRADSPENNALLQQVAELNERKKYPEAIERATALIARSPGFAEAYNQRAIAFYFLDRHAESAADCRRVLDRNPYHVGALSGLARCQLTLGQKPEALKTFRRALKLQPYSQNLREMVQEMESEGA